MVVMEIILVLMPHQILEVVAVVAVQQVGILMVARVDQELS
jgi:hypothetical protein